MVASSMQKVLYNSNKPTSHPFPDPLFYPHLQKVLPLSAIKMSD